LRQVPGSKAGDRADHRMHAHRDPAVAVDAGAHQQNDADREFQHLNCRAAQAGLRNLGPNRVSNEDVGIFIVQHLYARISQQLCVRAGANCAQERA